MRTIVALLLCAAYPLDAAGQSFSQCRSDGAAYYREIGSWPYLSTGESARAKVSRMCSRNVNAFASYRRYRNTSPAYSGSRLPASDPSRSLKKTPVAQVSRSQCMLDGVAYYRKAGFKTHFGDGVPVRDKVAKACSRNTASFRTYRNTSEAYRPHRDASSRPGVMGRVLGMSGAVALVALVIFVYFLPTIVSVKRKAHHDAAIVLLNILLGWTLVFWVAALLWAMSDETEKEAATRRKAMRKMAEA